ncbi:MAG: hypothetical protein LQ343_001336 [Gyalolechia ehrenbergii]|nr:MAG: hypothetical protein LQ343_001336 [Gyalolechia ehrenbergii]
MDHPICVVDATTFVDHIQEIKRLVYQDKIRLVVPQSTSASLENRYEKLTEEANKKPSRQLEPQRPRSSARPSKAEHPAVDINPLVAGEFLARLRLKEGQDAVEFQKDTEQYSPWKILELEEESRAASENRPTSFAQAVRKQSMEMFSNAAGATNGPQKPRLVARSAGADGSPWKKSNKALSLPITEVPKDTRPVFSCLLWRLHEKGATRWDTDRTVLLCNNEKTVALAKKLGVATQSMAELKKLCDTKDLAAKKRETFGDLERDLGIPERAQASPSHDTAKDSVPVSIFPIMDLPDENKVDASCAPEEAKSSDRSSSSVGIPGAHQSTDTSGSGKKLTPVENPDNVSLSKVTENDDQMQEKVDGPPTAPSPDHDNGPLAGAVPDGPIERTAQDDQPANQASRSNFSTLAVEKENSIAEWVRSLMDAANNSDPSGRNTPMSGRSSAMEMTATQPEPLKKFKPLTYLQAVTGKANEAAKKAAPATKKEIVPSPRSSPARDLSPPKLEDPIDSDEEIVVFNPKAKRPSAQKAQQNQQIQQARQAHQAQQAQEVQQVHQVQQAPRPQTPKPSPRHSHARNASGGRPHIRGGHQRQPRPGPPPVVIDPDSFGRGLTTNPQPTGVRTFSPYGAHGRMANDRRGNHRSPNHRPAVQNTPFKVTPLANGTSEAEIQPAADRSPAVNGLPVAESAPAVQTPTITTPPVVLKPSPLIHGPVVEPAVSGSSPSANGPQSSASAPSHRAERPRYSPRGSPRRAPAEPEVGYILRSGQPREATRGRGKLWVP